MITEDYVSFETAKLLKEKGFNEPCHCLWNNFKNSNPYNTVSGDIDGNVMTTYEDIDPKVVHHWYLCPTLQMAMKWLREVYDFNIEIDTIGRKDKETLRWRSTIYNLNNQCECYYNENCDSYEQAVEAAIKYSLENLI